MEGSAGRVCDSADAAEPGPPRAMGDGRRRHPAPERRPPRRRRRSISLGRDTNPSGQTRRLRIEDNLFYDIDAERWGGTGAFVLIGDGPADVSIEHNTVVQSGNILMAYGGSKDSPETIPGVVFRDNLIRHNSYGVIGADRGVGIDTLDAYFPGIVFSTNGIAGGESRRYPSGNQFVDEREFDSQFMNASGGDYRLRANSRFRQGGVRRARSRSRRPGHHAGARVADGPEVDGAFDAPLDQRAMRTLPRRPRRRQCDPRGARQGRIRRALDHAGDACVQDRHVRADVRPVGRASDEHSARRGTVVPRSTARRTRPRTSLRTSCPPGTPPRCPPAASCR